VGSLRSFPGTGSSRERRRSDQIMGKITPWPICRSASACQENFRSTRRSRSFAVSLALGQIARMSANSANSLKSEIRGATDPRQHSGLQQPDCSRREGRLHPVLTAARSSVDRAGLLQGGSPRIAFAVAKPMSEMGLVRTAPWKELSDVAAGQRRGRISRNGR